MLDTMPIKSTVLTMLEVLVEKTVQKLTSPTALLFISYNNFKPKLHTITIWLNRNLHLFLFSHLNVYSSLQYLQHWRKLAEGIKFDAPSQNLQKPEFALLASTTVGICSYIYIHICNDDSQNGKGIEQDLDLHYLLFLLH